MKLPASPMIRLLLAATVSGTALLLPGALPARAQSGVAIMEGDPNKEDTFRYDPPKVTVKAGTTVAWTNKGKQPHNVAAQDGAFDSGMMKSGATWQYKFDRPGDYAYVCTFHTKMTGLVQVTR
jgi:plastocyanin